MSYKVRLQIFEGPLDLLLFLVKQNHFEIAAIPIAQVTDQYLQYLELMQALDLEVAGEFLVVAATLMQIKSRMLLPPEAVPQEQPEEPDPAQELIERLKEYQKFKQAAEYLSGMEQERLVTFPRPTRPDGEPAQTEEELREASLFDLLNAFSQFMAGAVSAQMVQEILQDEFTVGQKVAFLRGLAKERGRVGFLELFRGAKAKLEAVAIFLALLELIRLKEVVIRQTELFGEILILSAAEGAQATA